MTNTGWAFVVGAALTFSGCYDFESPLDAAPQLPRDEAVLGQWRCLSAEPGPSGQAATIAFSPARDREYEVVLAEDDTAPERFSGYASAVSGGTILNLREQDGKDSGELWTLVRYSFLLPNVLRFELVDDEPLEGEQASPATLRSALERLGAQPGVHEEFCICVRIAKERSK